jgi:hypothetical protein
MQWQEEGWKDSGWIQKNGKWESEDVSDVHIMKLISNLTSFKPH